MFLNSTHRWTKQAPTSSQGLLRAASLVIVLLRLRLEDKGDVFVSFLKKNQRVLRIFFFFCLCTCIKANFNFSYLWNCLKMSCFSFNSLQKSVHVDTCKTLNPNYSRDTITIYQASSCPGNYSLSVWALIASFLNLRLEQSRNMQNCQAI